MKPQHDLKYPLPNHVEFLEKYIDMLIAYDIDTAFDECLRFTLFEYYQHLYIIENIIFAEDREHQQEQIRAAHRYLKDG